MTEAPHGLDSWTSRPATVRVDWLSFTLRGLLLTTVRRIANTSLGCRTEDWEPLGSGRHGYVSGVSGPGGALVLWSPRRTDIHCRFPGKACALIDTDAMRSLLSTIKNKGRVTRIDVAIDDYRKIARPEFVRDQFKSQAAVTRATRCDLLEMESRQGESLGEVVHIGSMTSSRSLVVYDKELESSGRIPSIRWELRARDEGAAALLRDLTTSADWGHVVREHLVGFLDFQEDGRRCGWYAELVGDVNAARVDRKRTDQGLDDRIRWVREAVSPTLAAIFEHARGDVGLFLDLLDLSNGKRRWSKALVRAVREAGPLIPADGAPDDPS